MDIFLAEHALLALLLLSFLAATLLPLGSEWLLVTLILQGHDPAVAVGVATLGNTLGACTTYLIGSVGSVWLIEKVLRIDANSRRRAEGHYTRYGSWSLLLSWLPIVGDPLCLIGGLMKVRFSLFLILVASGKLIRYALIAWLALQSTTA